MNKKEALDIILKCARQYDLHLKDQNIMFVVLNKDKSISYFETFFRDNNFLHLTGVTSPLNSVKFYRACIDNMLSLNQFNFKDNTTELKLQILNEAMQIDRIAQMVGEFNNSGLSLYTQKVVGTVRVCMGLVKDSSDPFYVPNTVLKTDIRSTTIPPALKIACMLKKPIKEEKYTLITSIGRKIDLKELPISQSIIDKLSDRIKPLFGLPVTSIPEKVKSSEIAETVTISKDEYNNLLKINSHLNEVIDRTNLVLNEHPKLKDDFRKAKAETLQRKAEQEKSGFDKSVNDTLTEHKPKKHGTKL